VSWTERQRQMLSTMGLVTWQRPEAAAVSTDEPATTPSPAASRPPPPPPPQPSLPARPAGAGTPLAAPPVLLATAESPAVDDGRRQHISRLDWPALRDAVAQCQACTLCRTRQQTVFGVGHPQAQWMVVGEAPGEQEDRQGEPFVGAAGQLLDNMLRALGLSRADDDARPAAQRVYIANTLKCRPPRNRNPEPGEILACEPFLTRQIALLQPRLILAMGRFAVQTLLRSHEPVGRLRGKVHRYQGVPLVVTYHPAYLLRNLPDKARAWDDLCLAARVFEEGA
jgi:DNA polymerase